MNAVPTTENQSVDVLSPLAPAAYGTEPEPLGSAPAVCDICFCPGSSWVPHCCVTMHSILSCSAVPKRFRFHVFGHNHSPDDLDALAATAAAYGASMHSYRIDATHLDGMQMPKGTHLTVESLFRLMIPELLPAGIRYALYLDCDTMATGDLADLFPLDWCGEAMVAGAADSPKIRSHAESLGVPSARYINAGVLVMNTEAWRRERSHVRTVEWIREHPEEARFIDQDAVNVLFQGRIKYMSSIWNHISAEGMLPGPDVAPEDRVRLVHFAGSHKPWHYRSRHPLKMEYYRYLDMTPFAGRPPMDRSPGRVWREIRRTIRFALSHPRSIPWLFDLDAMKNRILYNDQNWPTP